MLDRRGFLAAGTAALSLGGTAAARELGGITLAAMRGSIDASDFGVFPGAPDDQSRAFQRMLDRAAESDLAVHLPAGLYRVSNIALPLRVRLSGVPGATRIVDGGGGHLLLAEGAEHLEFSGITFDGANGRLGEHVHGLLDLRRVPHFVLEACRVIGSGGHGLALERVGGRIERSHVSGAAEAGIWSVDGAGLTIAGNEIVDCANGGILVHRWQKREDGTIVSGNRVARIAARHGGTGQFGNGINVFRADNVTIANNQVSDCAFSAIRANSGGNLVVTGNTCLRSGETALYAEFSFEGAVISSNIVDGAANGISIVNFNEGGRLAVCSGNLVRNLSTEGPYPADPPGFGVGITIEADTAATGNVIENAPRYGMHVGWGPFMRNVTATGNVIRKAGTGIAVSVVEGTGSAVIAQNVFEDVPGGAVVGHRWSAAVTGDLAERGAERLPGLTVEHNLVR